VEFMTITEAAKYLGMTYGAVRKNVIRGNIKAYSQWNRWLIPRPEVEAFKKYRRPVGRPRKEKHDGS
jgi:excisionase family DNA binding protein